MKKHIFLVAIGTDELPPNILKKLGADFYTHILRELKKNNISVLTAKWFAAPRHLAVKTEILISEQNLLSIQNDNLNNNQNNTKFYNYKTNIINLHTSTNYNDKQLNKLYKNNINQEKNTNAQNFKNLLLITIDQSLNKLTNFKTMRWGTVRTPFIRPVNTITILVDSYLISGIFFNINVGRILYGHRYIKNNKITLNHANDYPDVLINKGYIIVDYNVRKNIIRTEIEKQASYLGGIVDIRDEKFLEEIASSIEWPVVLFGKFDKKFLKIPSEITKHIMQKSQKYFPVYNIIDGILLPYFIFVINTITNNYNKIIIGHENIIKARFTDAEFFLKNDNQSRLEENIFKLNSILFHKKLGSLRDKVTRIEKLSEWIANQINEDVLQAKRAGYLCKCDLASDMVREFPDLQGTIGMYYAHRDKESETVALAQKEHYQPKHITDVIPTKRISCIVSIADKIDTICGIFGSEKFPTNNRDPFALKRSAIGVLNIIIQKKMSLNLTNLINEAIKLYQSNFTDIVSVKNNIYQFIYNRLYSLYLSKGYRSDIIKSVLPTNQITDILTYEPRIKAIDNFYKFKKNEYIRLQLMYKRITNILKKQNIASNNENIQEFLLKTSEEKQLYSQIINSKQKLTLLLEKKSYNDSLIEIEHLSYSVNNFLNNVTVIDNDQHIKINRLILLNILKNLILKVINISILHT